MIFAFEKAILEAIYSLVGLSGFIDDVFLFCSRFLVYIIVVIFLGELLVHREPYERLTKICYTSLALIFSAGILQGLLGFIISRESPATVLGMRLIAEGGVFPAAATTWAVTIAIIAGIAISKRLGGWLMALAIIVAFAQLYVGENWPLDIVTSFVIGILGAVLARRFIEPVKR